MRDGDSRRVGLHPTQVLDTANDLRWQGGSFNGPSRLGASPKGYRGRNAMGTNSRWRRAVAFIGVTGSTPDGMRRPSGDSGLSKEGDDGRSYRLQHLSR